MDHLTRLEEAVRRLKGDNLLLELAAESFGGEGDLGDHPMQHECTVALLHAVDQIGGSARGVEDAFRAMVDPADEAFLTKARTDSPSARGRPGRRQPRAR